MLMSYLQSINYLAVLVAGLAFVALGFLWYSPILFAKPWSKMMGYDMSSKAKVAEMQKKAGPAYAASFVGALVQSVAIAVLLKTLPNLNIGQAALFGALLWFGLQAPFSLSGVLYAQKPLKLWGIDAGYQLVGLVIAASILQAWK
jgi:hypothetical protein